MKKNYFKVLVCLLAMAGVLWHLPFLHTDAGSGPFTRRSARKHLSEKTTEGRQLTRGSFPLFSVFNISMVCVNMLFSYVVM